MSYIFFWHHRYCMVEQSQKNKFFHSEFHMCQAWSIIVTSPNNMWLFSFNANKLHHKILLCWKKCICLLSDLYSLPIKKYQLQSGFMDFRTGYITSKIHVYIFSFAQWINSESSTLFNRNVWYTIAVGVQYWYSARLVLAHAGSNIVVGSSSLKSFMLELYNASLKLPFIHKPIENKIQFWDFWDQMCLLHLIFFFWGMM